MESRLGKCAHRNFIGEVHGIERGRGHRDPLVPAIMQAGGGARGDEQDRNYAGAIAPINWAGRAQDDIGVSEAALEWA